MADVIFPYKVLNGYMNVDLSNYFNFYSMKDRYIVRGSDDIRLKKKFARTKFSRIVDCWNTLRSSIHNGSNLKTFRSNLIKYLSQS